MKLAMIDLKISNLFSVKEAFRRIGFPVHVASSTADLSDADAIVLPGVGSFEDGMASLRQQGLGDSIRALALREQKPVLGICLGMQLLAEASEEFGEHEGLALIRGRVVRLEPPSSEYRVPNMGWCDVNVRRSESLLFEDADSAQRTFYFAHSFHLDCTDPTEMVASINYGRELAAAVERNNVFGVQFHPEKSQSAGLSLLAGFCRYVSQFRK